MYIYINKTIRNIALNRNVFEAGISASMMFQLHSILDVHVASLFMYFLKIKQVQNDDNNNIHKKINKNKKIVNVNKYCL